MTNSGIYLIQNLKNGKGYVGSSSDIKNRFRQHKRALRKNKHHNNYLQHSYDKYGEAYFNFIQLEDVENIKELTKKELEWILKLRTNEKEYGYNMTLPNEDHPNGIGKHSEDTKEKLRKAVYKTNFGETSEEDYQEWKNSIVHREPTLPIDTTVIVFNYENGELLYEFSSPKETANELQISIKKIIAVLNEERKGKGLKIVRSYRGLKFIYKRNIEEGKIYKKDTHKNMNRIIQLYDKDMELLGEYNNMKKVSEEININTSTLASAILKGTLVGTKYYLKYKQ